MAFVSGGFFLEVTLIDNGGNETTRTFELSTTDPDNVDADVTTILAALGGVTDCAVVSRHSYEKIVNDALAFPASGVEIQNQALLDYQIADDPTKTATQTIPGPKPAIFVTTSGPGANTIDLGNAAVVAWAALFGVGGQALISDGEVGQVLLKGIRRHVKSSRG